jgi:hypothetical protein
MRMMPEIIIATVKTCRPRYRYNISETDGGYGDTVK